MNKTWKEVKGRVANLNVLVVDGKEVGFIEKPKDTATDKNAWRCFNGIGFDANFLGHRWKKVDAKRMVEASV